MSRITPEHRRDSQPLSGYLAESRRDISHANRPIRPICRQHRDFSCPDSFAMLLGIDAPPLRYRLSWFSLLSVRRTTETEQRVKITQIKKGLIVLGLLLAGGLAILVAYGAIIEFSCRKPWRATEAVRSRIKPKMTLAQVLATAHDVQGAQPEVASGNGVDGPLRLWIGSGFECQCYVPIEFAGGRVAVVGDPDLM
jgi:hypothetical protein